jgi:isochorismate hydrolase
VHQVTRLVLLGIATSGVVLSTVRWAADADYEIIVLEDCRADADEEVHRVLMQKVFPRQATVVQAQEFLQALAVTDCNGNGSGLQSTGIWDQIICIYPSLQDGIICH